MRESQNLDIIFNNDFITEFMAQATSSVVDDPKSPATLSRKVTKKLSSGNYWMNELSSSTLYDKKIFLQLSSTEKEGIFNNFVRKDTLTTPTIRDKITSLSTLL